MRDMLRRRADIAATLLRHAAAIIYAFIFAFRHCHFMFSFRLFFTPLPFRHACRFAAAFSCC